MAQRNGNTFAKTQSVCSTPEKTPHSGGGQKAHSNALCCLRQYAAHTKCGFFENLKFARKSTIRNGQKPFNFDLRTRRFTRHLLSEDHIDRDRRGDFGILSGYFQNRANITPRASVDGRSRGAGNRAHHGFRVPVVAWRSPSRCCHPLQDSRVIARFDRLDHRSFDR